MDAYRRWLGPLSMALVLLLASAAWYAARSHLALFLYDSSAGILADSGTISRIMMFSQLAILVGYGFGAIGALAIGPLATASFGLFACAVGVAMTGTAHGDAFAATTMVAGSIGYGIAWPAAFAAAARHLDRARDQLRHAVFVGLWVATNLGALVAPSVADLLQRQLGFPAVFALSGMLLVAAAVLAGAAALGDRFLARSAGSPASGFSVARNPALLSAGLVLLLFLPWALVFSVYDLMWTGLHRFGLDASGLDHGTLMQVNPVAVVVLGLLLVVAYGILHVVRFRLPALVPIGLGLLLLAAGALPMLFPQALTAAPLLIVCLLLLAAGEILAGPAILSTVAGSWPWRLSTAAVAVWLILGRAAMLGTTSLQGLGDGQHTGQAVVWLGVLLCGLLGLVLIGAAWPLRGVLDRTAAEPSQSSR